MRRNLELNTILFTFICIFLAVEIISGSVSPLKYCILVIFVVLTISAIMWKHRRVSWGPLLLALLFVGGLMIVYTIMSSTSPNLKGSRNPMVKIFMWILIIATAIGGSSSLYNVRYEGLKEGTRSLTLICILSMLISLYLYGCRAVLFEEGLSARSYTDCP